MSATRVRQMTPEDQQEVAALIHTSVNTWYRQRGHPDIFPGGPEATGVFYNVYNALEPGYALVAQDPTTGRLVGSCFYHPRKYHVGLGIMNVHPEHFGKGIGRELLRTIINFTDRNGYRALRLTQSALNLDSFSLYNRAGFVPRHAYQDMMVEVSPAGFDARVPGREFVRDAKLADWPAMSALELELSGVTRDQDYSYCIENELGFWHTSIFENARGTIDGFLISSRHPAVNMLGPGVCRTDEQAIALIARELDVNYGRSPVVLVPVERTAIVRQMYEWGARNCELHFCQVRGEFKPFQGVNFPTFILETA